MDPKQLLFIGISLVTISSVYPLLCTPCSKTQCIQPVNCKGGLVDSICGCCSICAKVEGEVCGGRWQKEGLCDSRLTCVVRDRKKKTGVGLCEPAICKEKKCGFREVCTIGNSGLPICTCAQSCGSSLQKPVCGYSNGKQYSNECELYKDECISGHAIGLMQGPCKKCFHAGKTFRLGERRGKDPCNICRCFHGEWKCHLNSQCPHVMVRPCTVSPYVHGKARLQLCQKGYKCKVQIPAIPEANIPGVAVCVPRIPPGNAKRFSRSTPSSPLQWTAGDRKEGIPLQCLLVPEEGPCRAAFQRWYYNEAVGKCMTFPYGGCEGNGNNFYSKAACRNFCIQRKKIGALQVVNQTPVPHTGNVITKEPLISLWKEICKLPSVTGPCRASFRRWYYNWSRKKCLKFTYGGCRGNMNNFHTKEDCKKHCMKRKVSTLTLTPVSTTSPSVIFYCRCTQCSGKDTCATSVGCFSTPGAEGGGSKRGCLYKSEDYLRKCTRRDHQNLLECCKEDMCNDFAISEESNSKEPKEAGTASPPPKRGTSAARCHDSPSDKFYGDGESWEPNDCTVCVCRNGTPECLATVCRHPDCSEPLYVKGQCCPMCPLMLSNSSEHNQAELIKAFAENKLETVLVSINHGHHRGVCRDIRSGKMYLVGQSWQLDQCTTCYCGKSGKAACAVQMCERDPQCKNLFHHSKHCCPMCKDDHAVKSTSHCYDTVTKKYYREAELWQRDDCTSCYCGEDRKPECTNTNCPPLECKAPLKIEKRCCRVCPDTIQQGCMYDGQKFPQGDFKLMSDQCTLCLCENGDWNCSKDSCQVSQVQQDGRHS